MHTVLPSRLLLGLLRRLSSRQAADSVVGDIQEELHQRTAEGHGPRWPRLSLNLLLLAAIAATVKAAVPRVLRAAALVVRDASRAVRRTPSHAVMVSGVLAIGITAGTVTFSVVDAVLLKPLPIEDGDRLVMINSFDPKARKQRISGEVFWQLHDHTQTLDGVAPFGWLRGDSSSIAGLTDEFPITFTMSEAFQLLRLSTVMGRLWTAEEEARGETDVAVLGYRFWQRDLGGRPDVLGLTLTRGKRSYRVIGVLSAASDHPGIAMMSSSIWLPSVVRPDMAGILSILARVRADRTRAMVADELRALAAAPEWAPVVTGPLDDERGRIGRWMMLALGASALLVLLGCVNAANLMLSRSVSRARELAVRASLGASNRRIAASVIAEGLLLSLGGTALALVVAGWGVGMARYLFTTLPLGISQAAGIVLNARVMTAAVLSAFITGVLFSLVPAWQATRASIVSSLNAGTPTASGGRGRWRRAFLVTEVATVTVLLVVSWLFVASLVRVVGVDLGVDRSRLIGLAARVPYKTTADDVVERVRRVPGVADVAESTGAMMTLFMSGVWMTTNVSALDAAPAPEPPFEVFQYRVTPNFFAVAGIGFLQGSVWADGTPNPVVLDQLAARRLFGETNPLGRHVRATEPAGVHTVVGVVPSLRAKGPEQDLQMAAYFPPHPRRRAFANTLVVRTNVPPDAVVPRIAEALAPVAPNQKDPFIHSFDEATRRITMMRRFNAGLMSVFGLVGVLIGAAGIYAVTGSVVAQQTKEIGVRMALGARPQQIARQVLRSAFVHIGLGLALGLPMAWWLSRSFGSLLFGITPADPSVYAGVSVLVCAVGLLAALLPSRRAARVDPIISLRA
jgi:putative ABC transport system permease protein